ncbi:hypothetical protein F2P56_009932 [Juglans regia]|uniref:RNase H type-1 domain-containing protein n=1 Tax=Juglans regia TaxID=51240 RepID=A0A833XXY5_JUGRE|nr:hypothetical protein F2P56_009932 [Juglans regia]
MGLLPAIITWRLWGRRCKARMEGLMESVQQGLRKEFISPITWKPPKPGWVKLNVDGCSLGNPGPSGAGGIIRDDKGDLICRFAEVSGHNSNNYAELMGLLHGLRECNLVADGFAKMGAKGQYGSWFSLSKLPANIRGFFCRFWSCV